jgi:acyl-CoA-binding protein
MSTENLFLVIDFSNSRKWVECSKKLALAMESPVARAIVNQIENGDAPQSSGVWFSRLRGECEMWKEWDKLRGISQETAQKLYIDFVTKHSPSWRSAERHLI